MNKYLVPTMAVLSLIIAAVSYRFLALGFPLAFPGVYEYYAPLIPAFLVAHVIFAPIALAGGGLQFFPHFRARRPDVHRMIGRVTAFAILIAGLSALGLVLSPTGRPIASLGFGLLAVLWLFTTIKAVIAIRSRQIDQHRSWMTRSFALTFAAVTLRLQLPLLMIFGEMSYGEASIIVAWSCWVPNMIFAEWVLRRSKTA